MAHKNQNWDKLLELIFNNPDKNFTVREISKKTKIPSSTIQRYLEELKKNKFVTKENYPIINPYFKFKKSFFLIEKLYTSGLINHLINELNPSLIIVFGSVRKGEYEKESDIDLFVETPIKKDMNLKKYEKILKHKIQLFTREDINKLQKNLFNNVINGIKLYGTFKVK